MYPAVPRTVPITQQVLGGQCLTPRSKGKAEERAQRLRWGSPQPLSCRSQRLLGEPQRLGGGLVVLELPTDLKGRIVYKIT